MWFFPVWRGPWSSCGTCRSRRSRRRRTGRPAPSRGPNADERGRRKRRAIRRSQFFPGTLRFPGKSTSTFRGTRRPCRSRGSWPLAPWRPAETSRSSGTAFAATGQIGEASVLSMINIWKKTIKEKKNVSEFQNMTNENSLLFLEKQIWRLRLTLQLSNTNKI